MKDGAVYEPIWQEEKRVNEMQAMFHQEHNCRQTRTFFACLPGGYKVEVAFAEAAQKSQLLAVVVAPNGEFTAPDDNQLLGLTDIVGDGFKEVETPIRAMARVFERESTRS